MRTYLAALALVLTACSPPAPQAPPASAPQAPAAQQPPPNPDVAALSAAPAEGQWFARADEGVFAAGFGVPQSEYQFAISCSAPSGVLTLMSAHELAPDQPTTLRLITAVQSIELPARSFNEGLPNVTAELADNAPHKAPLISMLGAPTDRFAVEVAGETHVYPWHDSIAATLTACR